MFVKKGTHVEIESVVLHPQERAPGIPTETQLTPYMMRVSGFLSQDAYLGETVTITSVIGRTHTGFLRAAEPAYTHSFGKLIPELHNTIATELNIKNETNK